MSLAFVRRFTFASLLVVMLVALHLSDRMHFSVYFNRYKLTAPRSILSTDSQDTEHIVFIGDSLTRYQFLALLYRLIHRQSTPDYIVSEKVFSSWTDFYFNSTHELMDVCKCDCFRPAKGREDNINEPFLPSRENRFCSLPSKPGSPHLRISYYQLFGELPSMHGMVWPNETDSASIDEEQRRDKWAYADVTHFLKDYLAQTRPTHIILAAGAHPHTGIQDQLTNIIQAARRLTQNLYWKESAPFRGSLPAFTDSFSRPLPIDQFARKLCEANMCTYIPFPDKLPVRLLEDHTGIPAYWDDLHFSSGRLYDYWNDESVQHIHLHKDSTLRTLKPTNS